ncbi:MAG: hypothetical protein AAGA93_28355, partial [Actinomycetota bacterium]
CHGSTPGLDGSYSAMSEEDKWNAFCTDFMDEVATRVYVDGSTVVLADQGEASEERVRLWGYDPTGVYGTFTASCFHGRGDSGFGGEFTYTITDPIPVEVLRARAKARIDIGDPPVDTNPSFTERFTIVQIPTWLWVDADYWNEEHREDESAGFVTVEVFADPVDLTWDFSGGRPELDCPEGPGSVWAPGADDPECSVTFRQSSAGEPNDAFSATATVAWEFTWTLNGADQGPFDDLLPVETDFELQVGEIQAVEN